MFVSSSLQSCYKESVWLLACAMFVVFCNLILARLLQRKRLIELKRLGVSIDPNLFYALFHGSTRLLRNNIARMGLQNTTNMRAIRRSLCNNIARMGLQNTTNIRTYAINQEFDRPTQHVGSAKNLRLGSIKYSVTNDVSIETASGCKP